ncbi:ABC-F family ATP-binding cassette domain-containing protein [Metabacillus sediminilitoris]|uniref:ABC-F family ATP-binding cassette domain-containing protein n=1 Tax=Metabacillus sediminilitoris TaxID=2567941 RepID=A0A4S4BL91_9BACI|nr:ABC-F family ATP-binding cassette domain-containing protein [Metabacillus sediminilitoris]QGQ44092.1 ATP-binding cassette domain-containing protein [Metabacillus sediminilitoris]THF75537.1 ABC-F family ATP-binding cassette domain-containing protein [Metabacillus sediminilitoris]
MILLQINQLSKYFGPDPILTNIKLEVQTRDKIAIVGRNGAGKSTLLKIIAGYMSHDSGEIIKPKDVSVGYLAQDTGLESQLSIWDEMNLVFKELQSMEKEMRNLEQQMAIIDPALESKKFEQLLKEYDSLQVKFKESGGYQYEADIRSVLHGLGFSTFDSDTKIASLSGGQRTRLALGKLLLTNPDLLILDEPTNHLDIETLTWLEQYLQNYSGAILIVSHDRYFLDKIVTQVYEISRQTSTKYIGNYSSYLKYKAENYEKELKTYEKQQEEVAKLKDFIQRNLARASTTKLAQSRRKKLEKMDILNKPLGDEKSANFQFDIERQSGNDVLKATNISVSYDSQHPIISNISFSISRGDSIALIGPNGIGKSTLLKSIVQKLDALSGTFALGSHVQIGYYDQQQADLTSNKRLLDELWDDYPQKTEKEIRTVLGNFLFSGDDVLKPVSTLSGGEKARLALAKLMLQNANFLILDEPTNHLDLDSKEILENALIDYPGTILFVSHDRYFINRITTKIFELSSDNLKEYLGDYDYYMTKKEEQLELLRLEQKPVDKSSQKAASPQQEAKLSYQQEKELKKQERQKQRRIEEIEDEIATIEEQVEKNDALLCDPDIYQNHEEVQKINTENDLLQAKLENLMNEWEQLH